MTRTKRDVDSFTLLNVLENAEDMVAGFGCGRLAAKWLDVEGCSWGTRDGVVSGSGARLRYVDQYYNMRYVSCVVMCVVMK